MLDPYYPKHRKPDTADEVYERDRVAFDMLGSDVLFRKSRHAKHRLKTFVRTDKEGECSRAEICKLHRGVESEAPSKRAH